MATRYEKGDRARAFSDPLCINCNQKPRYSTFKFCSRECGRTCRLPNCSEKKHEGSLYCSQDHRRDAVTLGIVPACSLCDIYPKGRGTLFCGRMCKEKAAEVGISDREDDSEEDADGFEFVQSPMGGVPRIQVPEPFRPPTPPSPPPQHYSNPESPSEGRLPPPRSGGVSSSSFIRGGWDKRVPRPPHIYTKPRSAYQISFGEYGDQPSFLLRSKKGLVWANIPPALERLCKQTNMGDQVMDFSLGTEGKFYFVFKDGKEAKIETSTDLWVDLNEDFKGGSIMQIQFGAEHTIWGLRSYRKYKEDNRNPNLLVSPPGMDVPLSAPPPYSARPTTPSGRTRREDTDADAKQDGFPPRHRAASNPNYRHSVGPGGFVVPPAVPAPPISAALPRQTPGGPSRRISGVPNDPPYTVEEEPFGSVPQSMIWKSAEIYPELTHYGQVDFAAVGMGGSWVIGVLGKLCFWDNIEASLVRKMTRVYADGGSVRNVVLSPISPSIYFLETKDGHVNYWVPDEWFPKIKSYLTPENALDNDSSRRRDSSDQVSMININENIIEHEGHQREGMSGPGSAYRGRGRGRGNGGDWGERGERGERGDGDRDRSMGGADRERGGGYRGGGGGGGGEGGWHGGGRGGGGRGGGERARGDRYGGGGSGDRGYGGWNGGGGSGRGGGGGRGGYGGGGRGRGGRKYHAQRLDSVYANKDPSSGLIKKGTSKTDMLVATISAAPAVMNVGITLLGLAGVACTIM